MKKTILKNEEIAQKLEGDRWPHLEEKQKWKASSDSFKRVCRMVKRLYSAGIPMEESVSMFRELYWCAYGDIQDMPKPKPQEENPKRTVPYFDEYEIMFRMNVSDLTPEELKRDHEFYSNLYISKGNVWWTNSGGGADGGPLHNFLGVVRLDNNYAFGPTKKQRGWPIERLAEVDAVGVYKRKEAPVKLGQRAGAQAKARRKAK